MDNIFFSVQHEQECKELLSQADMIDKEHTSLSELERRQKAFFYILALYQEAYQFYEGCKFYIEDLGELSLDGPVYLLDIEELGEAKGDHEIMLRLGMQILQGKKDIEKVPTHLQPIINEATELMKNF